jgi:hypothetical protein
MPKHGGASKRDSHGNAHIRHDGKAKLHRQSGARPLGCEPGIQKQRSVLDSGSAPKRAHPGMTVQARDSPRLRRKLTLVAKALWMIPLCSNR